MPAHASYLGLIPLFPLAGSLFCGLLALIWAHRTEGPPKGLVGVIATLMPAASFGVVLAGFLALRGLPPGERALTQTLFTWIRSGSLRIDVGFLLDPLSAAMLLFVTGIGALIHLYSIGYMAHDRGQARYFAFLNLFMFAMILLVLADNLVLLFVGWEGVGLCSYLLIGFWFDDPEKAKAGMKAFVVNRIGDFGFILGIFLLFWTLNAGGAPTLAFREMQAHQNLLVPVATAAALLLFLGATGKSAQIPLYIWLPDAMAGPTPVSALIHAATMVTAGVYMVARMNFLYVLSPVALTVVAVVGALTALLAATIGLTQFDIKKVLAYSTVSQLGTMFLGVGVGAFAAGLFHVITHAFFKALLFLGAGSVIHALSGEQDLRKMGGIFRKLPVTGWTFMVAWLAICGVFPFAGFFSKDEILAAAWSRPNAVLPWLPHLLWAAGFLGAGITAIYMTRLVVLTFFGRSRVAPEAAHHIHESPRTMTIPLVVLAAGALLSGFLGPPSVLHLGPNRIEQWCEPVFASGGVAAGNAAESGGAEASVSANAVTAGSAEAPVSANAVTAGGTEPGGGESGVEASPSTDWALMGASLALVLLAMILTWRTYTRRPEVPEKVARSFGGLYRLARDKYRVDEAYDAAVVRPLVQGSRRVLFGFIDVKVIDFSVNLVGILARLGSYAVRFAQTGYVQAYAFVLLLGLIAVLLAGR